jgi:MFS transporter, ACDE family, multidrug resistance protein
MSSNQQTAGWVTLTTLSSIPIVMVLGNSMLIPVLSNIQTIYGVSSSKVGLLITLFSIPAALVIPIAGFLADRVGRKKVIFFSLIFYGLGGILSGVVAVMKGSFLLLLSTRVIQGIGAAGTAPIAMVLTSDLYNKAERSKSLGIIEAANGMGKVLSPILGSIIALIAWYAMFFVFPVLCLPTALALWFLIKEPKTQAPSSFKDYKLQIKKIFHRHGRWLNVTFFIGAVTMFTMFGILFALSDMLENSYHLVGVKKGLILAIPLLALCTSSYVTGSHIKNQIGKMKQLIIIGLGLIALPLIAIPWVQNLFLLVSLLVIVGTGAGLVFPCLNMMITSAIRPKERGMITSLYASIRFFGVALGPPLFGALATNPYFLYFGTSVLVLFALILSIVLIHRPQRIRGKEDRSRILIIKKQLHST